MDDVGRACQGPYVACIHLLGTTAALQGLYKDFVGLFAQLPLAAVVESSTLILHGGLFRTPPKTKQPVRNLGMLPADVELQTGSLEDLRRSGKGGVDPDPDSKWLSEALGHFATNKAMCRAYHKW